VSIRCDRRTGVATGQERGHDLVMRGSGILSSVVVALVAGGCGEFFKSHPIDECTQGESRCLGNDQQQACLPLLRVGPTVWVTSHCQFGWSCVGNGCRCAIGPCCGADGFPVDGSDGTSCGPAAVCVQGSCVADWLELTLVASPGNMARVNVAGPGGEDGILLGNPVDSMGTPFHFLLKYAAGTTLALNVFAEPPYFVGWSGVCTGTARTCQVVVTGHVVVTATFQ